VAAYRRARELVGDQPQLLAQYAEAVAHANGSRVTDKARRLAARALEQDPDNQLALWIAGSGAMASGDGARAAELWRRLARQLPAGSDSASMIRGYIAQAEGKKASEVTIERADKGATAGPEIPVRITLAEDLRSHASPDDTVFIFARAPEGPPMPVAAVRKKVSDLPVEVTLSDAQAMMAGRKLSGLDRVVIGARVSKSGRPMAQSGDLEGTSDPMPVPPEGDVAITIDRQVP
jgi:cytochrome c-type biogenesis protein CcmH